jgi:hypothetical protein
MKKKKIFPAKKGVSGVITVVILITIVLAMSIIIWSVVMNITEEKLDEASCLGVLEKVSLNRGWTCYNSSSNETLVSVSIGDVEISKLKVSIAGGGISKTIEIPEDTSSKIRMYLGEYSNNISLPGKNAGKTYVVNLTGIGISGTPNSITLYPVLDKKTCQASDAIYPVDDCSSFVFS